MPSAEEYNSSAKVCIYRSIKDSETYVLLPILTDYLLSKLEASIATVLDEKDIEKKLKERKIILILGTYDRNGSKVDHRPCGPNSLIKE